MDQTKSDVRNPNESFRLNGRSLGFSLIDFWSWNQSNLVENRNRGILAEFLVKQALDINHPTRLEWDAFDLITADGVKIEVKSAAYIQSWKQKKHSTISFDIKPTKSLIESEADSKLFIRRADIYVFCLLHHKDPSTIDPMNLDQWTFYLTTTKTLNASYPIQKSIGLSSIMRIPHEECQFSELKNRFEKMVESH